MTPRKGGPFGRKLSLKQCPHSTKNQNQGPATLESANLHDPGAASMSIPTQYATCVSQRRLARLRAVFILAVLIHPRRSIPALVHPHFLRCLPS